MSAEATLRVDPAELAGKRALVTGGTAGVGAAIVSRLAAAGARVATTARSSRPAEDASDLYVQADVSTPGGIDAVARTIIERYGGVDVVVHNVGGSSAPSGGFGALTDDDWSVIGLPGNFPRSETSTSTLEPARDESRGVTS